MYQGQINCRRRPTTIEAERQMANTLLRLQLQRCTKVQLRSPSGLGEVMVEPVTLPVVLIRKGWIASGECHDGGADTGHHGKHWQRDGQNEGRIDPGMVHAMVTSQVR